MGADDHISPGALKPQVVIIIIIDSDRKEWKELAIMHTSRKMESIDEEIDIIGVSILSNGCIMSRIRSLFYFPKMKIKCVFNISQCVHLMKL